MWSQDNVLRLIFSILLMSRRVSAKEPQCSSFHYEEQLLSKVIRMEIAMEQQQQRVNDALEKMSQTIEIFKTDAIENENKIHKDSKLLSSTLTQNVSDAIGYMHTLAEKAGTPTIAFEAKSLNDLSLSSNANLVFTEAVFNHGNAYDVITGVFTCPLNGTYLFTSHLCSANNKQISYSLVVDDTVHTSGYLYVVNSHHCTSFDAIAVLQPASRVWVQTNNNGGNFYQDSDLLNTFYGVLLHG